MSNVLVNPETNMVRLPGCYDIHWPIYCDWLWAFWDKEEPYSATDMACTFCKSGLRIVADTP